MSSYRHDGGKKETGIHRVPALVGRKGKPHRFGELFLDLHTTGITRTFARYRGLAPTNAIYDVLQKTYVASETFMPDPSPLDSAEDYLTRVWSTSTGAMIGRRVVPRLDAEHRDRP